jgi:galactonate dehydratase
MPNRIADISLWVVGAAQRTNWIFVKVTSDDGRHGWGEATLIGHERLVAAAAEERRSTLIGLAEDQALALLTPQPHDPGGRASHAASSAIEQALVDIEGKRAGRPAYRLWGGRARNRLRLYANINRCLDERVPAAYARQAREVVNRGYLGVKIAPFDGIAWWDRAAPETPTRLEAAVACIGAVREAIGDDVHLMIDCHWRFDEPMGGRLIEQLAPYRPYWLECPISEHATALAAWARLRSLAGSHGIRLAGGETKACVADFKLLIDAASHDVIMPDIKYVGGFSGFRAIGEIAAAADVEVAPHNPTGPVSTAASAHACARLPNFSWLERQVDETPVYEAIVRRCRHRIEDGFFVLSDEPGLGIDLDEAMLGRYPPVECQPGLDPRLG